MTWLNQHPDNRARLVGGAHSGVVLPISRDEQRIEIGFAGHEQVEVYVRRRGDCVPVIFSTQGMTDEEVEQELGRIALRDAGKMASIEAERAKRRETAPSALVWRDEETQLSFANIRIDRDDEYFAADLYLNTASGKFDNDFYFDRSSAYGLVHLLDDLQSGAAGEATLECSAEVHNTSFLTFRAGDSAIAAISGELSFPAPREPLGFIVHVSMRWLIDFIRAFDAALVTACENPPDD